MDTILYIDGISQLHFVGGMVRADTFVLKPQPNEEPVPENVGQLVMTPQAFVGVINAMQQLADHLTEAGILQKS